MDPSEQQLAQWDSYSQLWEGTVRPHVQRAILMSEIARDFQAWLDLHGVMFPTVFSSADNTHIQKLVDAYNRIDRANGKTEAGTYGLKFTPGKIDIIAPVEMPLEEYQADMVTGFGFHPLLWVAAIGAVVVGAIFGTAHLIDTYAKSTTANTKQKIVESVKEISEMSPQMQAALAKLLEDNRDRLEEAGLLDQLLGTGSGALIAAAVGIGIVLFAYSRR